jgi:hypothetical protein
MHDLDTRDIWQTTFGKDVGGMAQGDSKTGQHGTNSIFVMTHNNILCIPTNRMITYPRVVVDFFPQKKTRIEFESRRGETSSITQENSQQKQQTSPHQN